MNMFGSKSGHKNCKIFSKKKMQFMEDMLLFCTIFVFFSLLAMRTLEIVEISTQL